MQITDIISITELSQLLKKSRPTVYKYISDFQNKNYATIPRAINDLFIKIQKDQLSKREIFEYCEYWFSSGNLEKIKEKKKIKKEVTLNSIFKLLKANETKINLNDLKRHIEKEINK